MSRLPGNVVNFGADPTGVEPADAAIQNAMDSEHAVYFPPGDYRLETGVTITRPKCVNCFGGSEDTGGVSNRTSTNLQYAFPAITGERVRFKLYEDINAFTIRAPIHWWGGVFDAEPISGRDKPQTKWHTKAFFYIPMDWVEGRMGGTISNVFFRGSYLDSILRDDTGTKGIHVDFENYAVDNAKLKFWNFDYFRSSEMNWHYLVTANNPAATGQESAGHRLWTQVIKAKRGIEDRFSDNTIIENITSQAGPIWADSNTNNQTATIRMDGENNTFYKTNFADYDKGPKDMTTPAGRYLHEVVAYQNTKTFNLGDNNDFGDYVRSFTLNDPGPDLLPRTINRGNFRPELRINPTELVVGQRWRDVGSAELGDQADRRNSTSTKAQGTMVYAHNLGSRLVFASGDQPGDPWYYDDGTLAVNP